MRRAHGFVALGLGWLLVGGAASAASGDGLRVGLATAGGELAGGLVGGAVGLSVGVTMCQVSSSFECMAPVVTAPLGGLAGAFGGALGGVTLGANGRHLPAAPARRAVLATEAVGVGVAVIGGLTRSSAVATGGLVISTLGLPVAAGLAARNSSGDVADNRRFQVSLSPTVGLHSYGLSMDGRF